MSRTLFPNQRNKGRARLFIGGFLVASLVAACGGDTQEEPQAPEDAQPLKIGLLLDLSGACEGTGEPTQVGAEMAQDHINAEGLEVGGERYNVELITKDTGSENTQAVRAANELIHDEGVKFLVGPICSSPNLPGMAPVAARGEAILYNYFPAPELEDPTAAGDAVETDLPLVFKAVPRADTAFQGHASGALEFFPDAQRIFIMLQNDSGGQFSGMMYQQYYEERGVASEAAYFDASTSDFTGLLTRAKDFNPDVLVYGYLEQPSTTILKQALQLDVAPAYYTTSGACCEDPLGRATGSVIDEPWAGLAFPIYPADPTSEAAEGLAQELKERLGREFNPQDGFALGMYDMVDHLVNVIEEAGTVEDTQAVAETWESGTFQMLLSHGEEVTWDEGHSPSVSYTDACEVVDGEVRCVALRLPPNE